MRFPLEQGLDSSEELAAKAAAVRPQLEALLAREEIEPSAYLGSLEAGLVPLAGWLARKRASRPLVIGVAGAQGSGKSTLAEVLQIVLEGTCQLRCARLSIDDLYLTRLERAELARTVHPLLQTRGVPGTHDCELGQRVLTALASPTVRQVALPRFDKASDDRWDESRWPAVSTPIDCVIFEGWCVGARPVPDDALEQPLNPLERDEDPDGRWRRHANAMLAGPYRRLFERIDVQVFLEVPDLECSKSWRIEQEHKLRARAGAANAAMSDDALQRFIQHYHRISLQMLNDAPHRADVVLQLSRDHRFAGVRVRAASSSPE